MATGPGRASSRPQFALVTLSGALYFIALGTTIAVLPVFARRDFGADDIGVGIAVGAFAFGAVVLRPFAGRIGDRWGRRPLVIGGAAVVCVSMFALRDRDRAARARSASGCSAASARRRSSSARRR